MSTSEEINDMFEEDIMRKTLQVYHRRGLLPFFAGIGKDSMAIQQTFFGILDDDDHRLLDRIEHTGD